MSTRYLLDTSVFSQPLRNRPIRPCLLRWQEAGDAACGVCAVVIAEVEFGLRLEACEKRWQKYRSLLDGRLISLEMDTAVWTEFSGMKARQQRIGETVADLDLLIAACATRYGMIVATLNRKDFSRIESLAWEDWSV